MYASGDWDQNYFSQFASSPFPCEKTQYLQSACAANGSEPIDYLAEQQCLCKGTYFANLGGCEACYSAHGYTQQTPTELAAFSRSISSAECSASPPSMSFNDLLGEAENNDQSYEERTSSIINAKPKTLGSDSFPSKTEVSNYWKSSVAAIPGQITGSATGRVTVYHGSEDETSLDSARTPASGGFAQGTGTEGSTVITTEKTAVAGENTVSGSGASTSATAAPSPAGNSAKGRRMGVTGGVLGVVLGVVALL